MLGDILHFHRTEGAKADMQGYMGDLYTGILYLLQKLFGAAALPSCFAYTVW